MNISKDELDSFLSDRSEMPPEKISAKIRDQVESDLNPSIRSVLLRLAFIHAAVSVVSVALCPQFGISYFTNFGLLAVFSRFGETICMFNCGAFFLGTSFTVAALVMTRDQLRVIRKYNFVLISVLILSSLGFFLKLGGEFMLSMTLLWVVGAFVASLSSVEILWRLRVRRISRY